jgi:hypothetical protein
MKDNFQVKSVASLVPAEIESFVGSGPLIFAGSFISVYAPTDLPTGQSFGQALYEYIFGESKDANPFLYQIYQEVPFEALMENCPNKSNALSVLTNLFATGHYNEVHRVLADRLKKKGVVRAHHAKL